jgi:hypothetical protein
MIKYKFPVEQVTYQHGYARVVVSGGLADIDENNSAQIVLAKQHGGVEAVEEQAIEPVVQKKRVTRRGE